jgi:hypothetical protein
MRSTSYALVLASIVAGCSTPSVDDTTTLVCMPPCPAGQTCTDKGCVGGGSGADFSAAVMDMATACSPACGAAAPWCNPSHVCVPCLTNDHCPAGSICKLIGASSACVPGCADDSRCTAASDGGAAFGKCCNGQCVDTARDPQNCGGCGMACNGGHAGSTCQAGACVPTKCFAGWGDCNMDPKDGCETNLHVDANNCTACGMKCSIPNATAGCSDGCYLQACNFGFDDCNGDMKDGCETNVTSDVKNCGACSMACPPLAHGKVACVNAVCALTQCDVGFLDCDNNPKNGCETVVANDKNNCGKCGNACGQGQVCINGGCTCANCNIANAATKCVNNACVFDHCVQGFGDCNNNVNDGCETDLTSDVANCGACGMACPMNLKACVNGVCTAATLHWKLVESSACNAWCQGSPWGCTNNWTCDMQHISGYLWIYSPSKVPPPLQVNANGYGWCAWFCGLDGGCRGPGPMGGNCGGGGPNTVWQCVYE